MIEMLLNPLTDKFQFSEINDKTVFIQFGCLEGNLDVPVMPVNKGTVSVMGVLTVGKWDISIDFRAGEHNEERKCSLFMLFDANGNLGKKVGWLTKDGISG